MEVIAQHIDHLLAQEVPAILDLVEEDRRATVIVLKLGQGPGGLLNILKELDTGGVRILQMQEGREEVFARKSLSPPGNCQRNMVRYLAEAETEAEADTGTERNTLGQIASSWIWAVYCAWFRSDGQLWITAGHVLRLEVITGAGQVELPCHLTCGFLGFIVELAPKLH